MGQDGRICNEHAELQCAWRETPLKWKGESRVLKGIFAPIPTPFLDEEVAYEKLEENLGKWGRTNLAGVVVMGSNGEAPYLDEDEKVELWAFTRKHFPKDKMVIAGTGQESTKATVRLTKRAADAGASAALVVSPSYFKANMKEPALETYYIEVADKSPVPVLIYNMPGNTGVNLSSGLVVRLSTHPNIAGVKDSSGNIVQISEIISGAPGAFSVFAGSASFLLPSVIMGARGGTLASANVVPDLCVKILDLANEGRIAEAREIQKSILSLNALVTSKYGVAGLKAALDTIGYFGGLPRRPMLPATDSEKAEIRKALEKLGLVR
jgi:4-hydroxy-2-oxoglutarate aldolase